MSNSFTPVPVDPSPPPTPDANRIPSHLLLQIHFPPEARTTIGIQVNDRLTLGRSDAVDQIMPDVDLLSFGAKDNGVSRLHVKITRSSSGLFVQDLQSRNGSQINGNQLESRRDYPLHDGDTMTLGQLNITVRFVYSPVK